MRVQPNVNGFETCYGFTSHGNDDRYFSKKKYYGQREVDKTGRWMDARTECTHDLPQPGQLALFLLCFFFPIPIAAATPWRAIIRLLQMQVRGPVKILEIYTANLFIYNVMMYIHRCLSTKVCFIFVGCTPSFLKLRYLISMFIPNIQYSKLMSRKDALALSRYLINIRRYETGEKRLCNTCQRKQE